MTMAIKLENVKKMYKAGGIDFWALKGPQDSAKVLSSILHGAFLQAAAAGNMDELMLLRRTVIEKILTNGI